MSAETKQPAAPQGDLAAWQERVSVSLESALYLCGNRNKLDGNEELSTLVFYIEQRVADAKAHLAAMPQAQPDAEMLAALKRCLLFINDSDSFEDRYGGPEFPESSINIEAWLDKQLLAPARAAIAQAEQGAPA